MGLRIRSDLLALARESRGMTQKMLAKESGISQPTISRLELGCTETDQADLDNLGKVLRYPPTFFMLTDRLHVGGRCIKYRRLKSVTVTLLKRVEAEAAVLSLRVGRLLRGDMDLQAHNEFRPINVGPRGDFLTPQEAAVWVRATWGLPHGPVASVTQAIEAAGGVIVCCDFGTPKITAISQWTRPDPPVVFLNSALPGDRLRLSLAHEMGHLFMHNGTSDGDMEQEAFAFASELLMPAREILPTLRAITMGKLASLKEVWGVSIAALVRWAWTLGAIDEQRYTMFNIEISRNGWKRQEPIDIPVEQPTLLSRVIDDYRRRQGFTDADLMATLLISDEDEYRRFLRQATSGPSTNLMRLI